MLSSRGLITVVALSAISVAFLWLTSIPLGVPGEWTWTRITSSGSEDELALGVVQAAIAGVVYVLVAWLGSRRVGCCSRVELFGWLCGVAAVGFGWLLAAQEAPPTGWRMSKSAFVLYYPGSSGYFHTARYEISNSSEFLRGYEGLMKEGDVLHVGTHPPGLFLLYRGLIVTLESRPEISELIESTAPASVREAFDLIDRNLLRIGNELTSLDRTVIWLMTVLTQACCVLAIVPIFVLIRHSCSREIAWRAAVFWPLLPALAIFIPKSDVLFVLPAALLMCSWMVAARRQSFLAGLLAGAFGWVGLFCSLAFLPIGLIGFVASLLSVARLREHEDESGFRLRLLVWRMVTPVSLWKPLLGGLVAVGGLTIAVTVLCEMNLLSVWIHNYRNHAAFYSQFSRTAWKWVLINPLELTLAAGVPVMSLAGRSTCRLARSGRAALQQPLLLSFLFVWAMLWLSGKNSGEAARLWCPLLPVLLSVSAIGLLNSPGDSEPTSDDDSSGERGWLILLCCQTAVCLATVTRVSGFHF
ncbi:MAG: hypothetical protein O3B13_08390 [Planctomycetota bacterium]|nr:hypothetical protein [Planctomycetota bacterium]MDA1163106.1 hypothetical protein [Planctomycetota bacterium]